MRKGKSTAGQKQVAKVKTVLKEDKAVKGNAVMDEKQPVKVRQLPKEKYRFRFYLNATHGISIDNSTRKIHPHTWEVLIEISIESGMFTPFSQIENKVQQYLDSYEGTILNEVKPFDVIEPTLENMGKVMWNEISDMLKKENWCVSKLEISESPSRTYILGE